MRSVAGAIIVALIVGPLRPATVQPRVQLSVDMSEAEGVLSILAARGRGDSVREFEWQRALNSRPYSRLKVREAYIAVHYHAPENELKDADFRTFVSSDDLLKREPALRSTLDRWKTRNLHATALRVLAYLPDSATIKASVYPVIKENTNSFVWEASKDPAIFLYLDPEVSEEKFENIVAHELHHIGLANSLAYYDTVTAATLEPRAREIARDIESFGEGLAMLAAAGGPDVDPHATSVLADRVRWHHDMANVDSDLVIMNAFFLDVVTGRIVDHDSIEARATSFFGRQGPWYTVGYRMAVTVENHFGRRVLINAMADPRRLLVLYNACAPVGRARWSRELLKALGV